MKSTYRVLHCYLEKYMGKSDFEFRLRDKRTNRIIDVTSDPTLDRQAFSTFLASAALFGDVYFNRHGVSDYIMLKGSYTKTKSSYVSTKLDGWFIV